MGVTLTVHGSWTLTSGSRPSDRLPWITGWQEPYLIKCRENRGFLVLWDKVLVKSKWQELYPITDFDKNFISFPTEGVEEVMSFVIWTYSLNWRAVKLNKILHQFTFLVPLFFIYLVCKMLEWSYALFKFVLTFYHWHRQEFLPRNLY